MTTIAVQMKGRQYDRSEVLRWEDRRIDGAARKLGVSAPKAGDIRIRREVFLRAKLDLGEDEIIKRLRRDTRWADRLGGMQAKMSPKRRFSVTDIYVDAGTAENFKQWFDNSTASSHVDMLRACPDHFVLRFGPHGQEVLETNGSSPLAAFFTIDYDDISTLQTPIDPQFPHQIAGVARNTSGLAIGGVRHQFRDTADGFHARLTVEFPLPTLPAMVAGHRWHLACEFSNWISYSIDAK